MAAETTKAGGTARSRGGARGGGGGADGAGTATADGTATRTRGGTAVVADGRRIRGGGSGATTQGTAVTKATRARTASAAARQTEEQREYAAKQKAFMESFLERRNKREEANQGDQTRWLAYETGLRQSQIANVLEACCSLIEGEIGRKGPGSIKFLGLMRIHRAERAASKARKIVNPITKEPMIVPARKKSIVAKVRPLTALKNMVSGPKAAPSRA